MRTAYLIKLLPAADYKFYVSFYKDDKFIYSDVYKDETSALADLKFWESC